MSDPQPGGYQPENETAALNIQEETTEKKVASWILEFKGNPDEIENLNRVHEAFKRFDSNDLIDLARLAIPDNTHPGAWGISAVRIEHGLALVWLAENVFPEEFKNELYHLPEVLKSARKDPDVDTAEGNALQGFVKNIQNKELLKGLRVAEIGGVLMAALRHWGADVNLSFEKPQSEGYINSNNFHEYYGDEKYHLTYSSGVFDPGSGIEGTLQQEINTGTFSSNATDLLKVFSAITKENGLSAHFEASRLFDSVGFEEIQGIGLEPVSYEGEVVVFRKKSL